METSNKELRLSAEDLTFRVSRWQRYLYSEERQHNAGLRTAEQGGTRRNDRFPDFQREVFSRLYNPGTKPLDAPTEGSEWASKLHTLAEEMAEFKLLQSRCRGDEVWSGMGTTSLAKSITAKMTPQKPKHNPEELARRVEGLKAMQSRGSNALLDKRLEQAQKALEAAKAEAEALASGMDPVQLRQAIRQGCSAAQDEISEAEEQMDAYSYGSSPGTPALRGNADQKRELANRIKDSTKLKRIAMLAGRLRRIAAEKQKQKVSDCRSEVSDIEQGDAINRLLPSELIDLLDGDGPRGLMFQSRFLERQLLQYRLSGKEKEGRGPIVICCDESGSMSGDPECWAKACSLALLDIARRQKRSWAFIHFDTRISRVDRVKAGAVDTRALMECMEHFTGGGTRFEPALEEATEVIEEGAAMKKADVLFVTDGICTVSSQWIEEFKRRKKELGFTVYAVLVNLKGAGLGAVEQFADHVFHMSDLVAGHDAKFAEACFTM